MKYGTILYQSTFKLISFILLAYCFTEQNRNHSQTINEASLPQENYMDRTLSSTTIRRWYNFFSWICVNDYRKTRTKIGGEGVKLEADKCKTVWHYFFSAKQIFRSVFKEPPQTFVPKISVSWYSEWANCKVFLEPKSVN